jgi:glycosyltransferase involved in cell wall biosynthesis
VNRKKKILFVTNALWLNTGLSRNLRTILLHLYKKNKYEITQLCQGVSEKDPRLTDYPWKCYGAIPVDKESLSKFNQDPNQGRRASYGSFKIDQVVEQELPDIVWLSDDIWAFPQSDFVNKSYVNKNVEDFSLGKGTVMIHHLTADSLPLMDEVFEISKKAPLYFWASFAEREMKRLETENYPKMIGTVPAAIDDSIFHPISKEERSKLRKKFNIGENTKIFFYLGRNQLRKQFHSLFEAFANYKKKNPNVDAKIFVHCSWTEGWPLEKIIKDLGIEKEDVLTTYVCKVCGNFEVKSYNGEDQDCRFCGAKKSQSSSNVKNGVSECDMRYLYGIADACLSLHTSGGFELHQAQSLLCGKPLATIPYSCGEDFAEQDFVYSIDYTTTRECNTGFRKSIPNIFSIEKFINKIVNSTDEKLQKIGEEGRTWALSKFSGKIVSEKWEEVFDSLPYADWEKVTFKFVPKNPEFIPENIDDDRAWVKHLYLNILNLEVTDTDSGLIYWSDLLKSGTDRKAVVEYFRKTAIEENSKNVTVKFEDIVGKDEDKKVLLVCPQSGGDIFLVTSLLESCKETYPDHKIFFACNPQFSDILKGNKYIDKIIPYHEYMESELAMVGSRDNRKYFDVYINVPIFTQQKLNYLSHSKPNLP